MPIASHDASVRLDALPVAVDAMGGDLGPSVVVEGALEAWRRYGIVSTLVGQDRDLQALLRRFGAPGDIPLKVVHAPETVGMEESPTVAIRRKSNSSIRISFQLLKEGRVAGVVSPGNTGAVMAAGIYECGVLPGIARPAIASLIPRIKDGPPTVLIDSGANVDTHAYQLVQFAIMGAHYSRLALGVSRPRIGLLSNGTEISKGTDIIRSAAYSLQEIADINFIGFVEGRDLPQDIVDVVVCDGFVGNVVLKAMEGTVALVVDSLKLLVERSMLAKLGMWLARPTLRALFSEKLDPSAHGGAPLLGLRGVAVVCHGASNCKAMMNGIRVAHQFVGQGLVKQLEESLSGLEGRDPVGLDETVWHQMGQRFDKRRAKGRQGNGAIEDRGGAVDDVVEVEHE